MLGSVMSVAIFGTLSVPCLATLAVAVGPEPTFAVVGAVSLALALRVVAYSEPARTKEPGRPATKLLRNRGIVVGAGLVTLASATFGAANALIPLRLAHFGASIVVVGATFLLASGISALVAPVSGRISDRRGLVWPMKVGPLASAALVALVPVPNTAPLLAVLSVLALGAPLIMWVVPAMSLITDAAERGGIAVVLSTMVINVSFAVGETVGAPAAAGLAETTTDAVPFLILAALMLAAIIPIRARERAASA
jgi:MFS family permease